MELYWTGARGSDTKYTGSLFRGSITIYGNNRDGNHAYCSTSTRRINHNVDSQEASSFILNHQLRLIEENPECRFMAYNPNYVFGAPESIFERTLCLNNQATMRSIDNKISFRNIASSDVSMLDCEILPGKQIVSDERLKNEIKTYKQMYVIQAPISTGGEGTFLVSAGNYDIVMSKLSPASPYLLTRYVADNIPINAHCIIYDDSTLKLPPSVQIIVNQNNRLLYRGADYISYRCISNVVKQNFSHQLEAICDKIRLLGYRGVVGFDAIVSQETIYFIEANNRFQGSTYALNCALWNAGLPSVQQLNLEAFGLADATNKEIFKSFDTVPYSYFIFSSDLGGKHAGLVAEKAHLEPEVIEHSDDGFSASQLEDESAYLFHLLFSKNISEIHGASLAIRVHPALMSPTPDWYGDIAMSHDMSKIKISLINQGLSISNQAKRYLAWEKKLRGTECFSIDLLLPNGQYANCPTCVKFVNLSPFALKYDDTKRLYLTYYGEYLTTVEYVEKPRLRHAVTSSGCDMRDIAFFSTDRLRLQNSPTCVFNSTGSACRFCEVYDWNLDFREQDILETIDRCFELKTSEFRHILIGGRSHAIGKERDTIIKMCRKIKEYRKDIPIYLMCLPPKTVNDIDEFYSEGITEFGFNIEIFDRSIAERIMPGKGKIPLQQYMKALEHATSLCGKSGAVRSAFVVGLEPVESLLKGVEELCKIGVSPILSAFRPIKKTPMEDMVPMPSDELYSITRQAEEIAVKYGLTLGPNCIPCQNNTLNIL